MRQKLIELSEIIKQKPEIKERLERLEFGCWVEMFDSTVHWIMSDFWRYICVDQHFLYQDNPEWSLFEPEKWQDYKIIGREPQYSDILEYLEDFYLSDWCICDINMIDTACNPWIGTHISLSPWTLAEQSDETLDEIISLCKNNVPRN